MSHTLTQFARELEDRERQIDNAAERALHRKKLLEVADRERFADRPTTAEMQSEICRHYADGYAAKQATTDLWRAQGRVLTFATAIELHYSQLTGDKEREAVLLAMYAKKRGEMK